MDLTLVITTFNRSAVLEQLLRGLEQQSDPDFQVVVAIDGSTDDTTDVLDRLRPAYDLKWVDTHCPGYGLAVARNLGIIAADGEAVVILDDDSVPVDDFIAAHKSSVRRGTITGGPRNPSDPGEARMAWKMRELARLPRNTPMSIEQMRREWPNAYLIENNICLYRKDWIDLGLFSERLKLYGFIGQEFFGRAEYLGINYQYNPLAAVSHHGELEGDNGLNRRKKNRQIAIADALRPELMTPRHYEAQVKWAKALSEGRDTNHQLQPFLLRSMVNYPLRRLRNLLSRYTRRAGSPT